MEDKHTAEALWWLTHNKDEDFLSINVSSSETQWGYKVS